MDKKRNNKILIAFLSAFFFFISIPVLHFSAAKQARNSLMNNNFTIEYNEFGLSADSLISSSRIFKENETFERLLVNLGLSEKLRAGIIKESNSFLEGFSSGDIYHTYWNVWNPEELQYIVLEKDPVNYVILDLNNTVEIHTGKKELDVRRKFVEGEIKTSFYNSVKKNDVNLHLIENLSEIYQWQIDFYRLKRGDKFKFIIEEKYAGDTLFQEPKIAGAYFNHDGKEFYAIRYNDGTSAEYYDLSGKNVKRAFLKAPLDYSSITSPYADSRFHPILKVKKPHLGTDYAAPSGTPIYAVADGIITEVQYTKGNGNYVRIVHDNTYSTQYLHMSKFAKGIIPGKRIRQGNVIGYVGSTGLSTGPHLCFRFWKNGVQVNPLEEKLPSNKELKGEKLQEFYARRDTLLNELGTVNTPKSDFAALAD